MQGCFEEHGGVECGVMQDDGLQMLLARVCSARSDFAERHVGVHAQALGRHEGRGRSRFGVRLLPRETQLERPLTGCAPEAARADVESTGGASRSPSAHAKQIKEQTRA